MQNDSMTEFNSVFGEVDETYKEEQKKSDAKVLSYQFSSSSKPTSFNDREENKPFQKNDQEHSQVG